MPPRLPKRCTLRPVLREGRLAQQPRRYAHDSHGAHHDAHHGPVEESFGKGFFIALAAIPVSLAVYKLSRGTGEDKPLISRIIDRYSPSEETWTTRNDRHVQQVEQAARDSNVLMNSPGSHYVDMRFPEIFNVGAPWNVPAGSQVNLDKVVEKYRKQAFEENEKKLQQLRDGTLPAEQPKRGQRLAPFPEAP